MKKRPNFIVIHADQLRADCLSGVGKKVGVYTPYIDSIGYQGANFTSCYANCPICIPQRLSLLTGKSPQSHGLFANMGIPYLPLETTLPAEMRRGGYQTALVGRTMHTYPFNHSYGFEYYLPGDPSSENKDTTDPFFTYLRDNTLRDAGGYYGNGALNNSRAAAPFHLDDHFHQTKWATNRALDFLDNHDPSRPFMLFVGYYAPHSPHNPPAEYFNRYYQREDLDDPIIADYDVPPVASGNVMSGYIDLKGEELRTARAGYYGNIAFMDSQIGRIIGRAAWMKDTYIIFTSDHGDLLGDHYLYQKNRPYEGAVHLPFAIMGPGISDCQTITEPIGWHDIMPTILDLAGLPIPDSVDGRSIKPLLSGAETQWREYIHGECVHDFRVNAKKVPVSEKHNLFYEQGTQYLTDGRMKYIWHITSGKEQLFDLEKDWKELHDLSGETAYEEVLLLWRNRLIRELAGREEGYSDGEKLIPGCTPQKTNSAMSAVVAQRRAEGAPFAFENRKDARERIDYENTLMN